MPQVNRETDWQEMHENLRTVVAWRRTMIGGMSLAVFLIGMGSSFSLWALNRSADHWQVMETELVSLRKDLAVFQAQVQPFISAGPRYTADNARSEHREIEATIKEWVRNYVSSQLSDYPPQWLLDEVSDLQIEARELDERLDKIADRINEMERTKSGQ